MKHAKKKPTVTENVNTQRATSPGSVYEAQRKSYIVLVGC